MSGTHRYLLGFLGLIGAMTLGGCSSIAWGVYPTTLGAVTAAQWQSDLATLRSGLSSGHPNLFHNGQEAGFDAAEGSLQSMLDSTPDGEARADKMVAGIARMLAAIGEGHTSINSSPASYFPVVVKWFALPGDQSQLELRVVRVDDRYRTALGKRVVGIGGQTIAGMQRAVDPYLSVDALARGNRAGYRHAEANALVNPRLMRGIGLADGSGLTYRLEDDAGGVSTLTVQEVAAGELSMVDRWSDSPATRALPSAHPTASRWYEVVGDTLYLRYNECELDAYGFFQGVVQRLQEGDLHRLIVDLRANGGGISLPGSWFARAVSGLPALNRRGGIYLLVGPATFSSAEMMAADFMSSTQARFVGETLAEPVDGWGEVKRFTLPNSRLVIGHSTRYFDYSAGKSLTGLNPDGVIEPSPGLHRMPTYAEWAAGRDPVYELALAGAGG